MKTTHTPGPWKIVPRTSQKGILMVESQHGLIACMESSKTRPVTYEKAEANAQLIAAAPDLLQALANIANCNMSNWSEEFRSGDDFRIWAQTRARVAIVKAVGACE